MNDTTASQTMPSDGTSVIRKAVTALSPFRARASDADARAAGVTTPIRRLHLNESPYPPSPRVIEAIRDAAALVNRYPDPTWRALAATMAKRTGVDTARIVFSNGSDELLTLLIQIVLEPGSSAVLPTPSFPRYMTATVFSGATPIPVPVRSDGANDVPAMLAAIRPDTKLVLCATPNNPTGAMLEATDLKRLATEVPARCLLLVDEAYFEFARHAGGPDALTALQTRRGPWAIVRTLSKAYGLAGMRVGYALLSGPEIAEAMNRVRGMFSVNMLAQIAALAALEDEEHTQRLLDGCATERKRLSEGFARLGCPPLPSVANFVSAQLPMLAADAVKAFQQRGILISTIGTPPFECHVRVTIGTADDTDAVLKALEEIVNRNARR